MSINSALTTGVSGLSANSAALATISNNIANVNTVGYKSSVTEFQDIVTSASQAGDSGGGVSATTRQLVTAQGTPTQTTSSTDLSISGNGFFVVTNKAVGNTATDARSFTRAGSFTTDSQGYLKNSAGLYLQGWVADPTTGVITTDPSNVQKLSSINISNFGGTASQTTNIAISANLNSAGALSATATAAEAGAAVGAGSGANGAYVAGDMALSAANAAAAAAAAAAGGTAPTPTAAVSGTTPTVTPDFSQQIPISDSQGTQRTIEMDYLKTDTPNVWNVEVRVVPPSDVDYTANPNGLIASGQIGFTTDGKLSTANPPTTLPTTLTFAASPAATSPPTVPPTTANGAPTPSSVAPTGASGSATWASKLGVSAQTITLNLQTAPGGLTQDASKSVVQSTTTNGTAFGNLTKVSISDSGQVTAAFDNGVTHNIAQVALATFPNADGLKAVSGDAFQVSLDSGNFNFKTPGSGGSGTLSSSTLESSTVDLSTEFTALITTQRAYSASSKIITTADQMLTELISIKQ